MKTREAIAVAGMLALMNTSVLAELGSGMPGDEFRNTANDYEDNALKAVDEATHARGKSVTRYLEIASIYREMAGIKRNAARLADQGKWDEIDWGRYLELESKRDALIDGLDWKYTRANTRTSSLVK